MLFECLFELKEPDPRVDGVELRLDKFLPLDVEALRSYVKTSKIPVLFTLRSASQGGEFKGSEEERLSLLKKLMTLEPDFFDIEFDVDPRFIKKISRSFPQVRLILSYHNFEKTPEELDSLLASLASPFAYAYKIATTAQSSLDALRLLLWLRNTKKKVIGLCMGKKGEITRILSPVFNSFINYTSRDPDPSTGQLSLETLFSIYHYHQLHTKTKLLGLIGDPVDQSIGYLTHNALIRHHGLDAVYVRMEVKRSELLLFLDYAKQCGFLGLSVTTPLKELFSSFPINTVTFKKETLLDNTDGSGSVGALKAKSALKGKTIALLGAGGAAKALARAALKEQAKVVFFNRTLKRAERVASELECGFAPLETLPSFDYDILVNATSELFFLPDSIKPHKVVMDMKTVPKKTPFLVEAEKKQCLVIYGFEMFIQQALLQFELWFNKKLCEDFLRKTCETLL